MRWGTWGLGVLALGGVWLMLAPFWVGFARPVSDPWTSPVLVSVLAGAVTTALSLFGWITFAGLQLRELEAKAKANSAARPTHEAEAPRA